MAVQIESVERRSVGDKVFLGDGEHVVTEVVVWSDAWGEYAHTVATFEPAGGASEPGEA